jgi:hypothetical protein
MATILKQTKACGVRYRVVIKHDSQIAETTHALTG